MLNELPPKIYRSLNHTQTEAQEALLLLSDTFQALEALPKDADLHTLHAQFNQIKQLSTQLNAQWGRFLEAIQQLQQQVGNWETIAAETNENRTLQRQHPTDPVQLLDFAPESLLDPHFGMEDQSTPK